jgi:hypothetical protein
MVGQLITTATLTVTALVAGARVAEYSSEVTVSVKLLMPSAVTGTLRRLT